MLIRIVASRVLLRRVVGRDPEVVAGKPSALGHARVVGGDQARGASRREFVAYGMTEGVGHVRIHHHPVTIARRVSVALGHGLMGQQGGTRRKGIAVRVALAR